MLFEMRAPSIPGTDVTSKEESFRCYEVFASVQGLVRQVGGSIANRSTSLQRLSAEFVDMALGWETWPRGSDHRQ
jgi:hypothetical protein